MLIMKPPSEEDERRAPGARTCTARGGYAVPRRPIRVLLARDEEAAGIESEATKIQPPAYGTLARERCMSSPPPLHTSIAHPLTTVNPPREWTPTGSTGSATKPRLRKRPRPRKWSESEGEGEPRTASRDRSAPRPPSYISDDGVSYVVEAQPRSVAPTTDVPLPQHPSEEGRTGQPAVW